MKTTVINNHPAQLDTLAWKAICEWPSMSDTNFCGFSADYTELTRWFLWDKVGRGIRFSSGYHSAVFEKELIETVGSSPEPCSIESTFFSKHLRPQLSRFFSLTKKKSVQQAPCVSTFQRRGGSLLYVPVLSDRLKKSACELISKNICQVAIRHSHEPIKGAVVFQPSIKSHPDHDVAVSVYNAIVDGLKGFGISLLAGDAATLHSQIITLTSEVLSIQSELEILKPNAIFMHSDNHPPFQVYALAARKMGIPVIMLQHGLDCENYYLDEAYASHIAVWGPERERRYRAKSRYQPNIALTGNPEFDHFSYPEKIEVIGDYWLWATRPHTSKKCFSPSRTPDEGVSILKALMEALALYPRTKLVIKPHPYDYRQVYEKTILESDLRDRIVLSEQSLYDLIPNASFVISEDSTAGMEAMFFGKLILHAHFALSRPTMPFVDYGAAFPGLCRKQLLESISQIVQLHSDDAQKYLIGQIAFLKDFAGSCDGKSANRFVEFVSDILRDTSISRYCLCG